MELGITVFNTDHGMAPSALAQAIEERGFASFYLPEHTHLPVDESTPPGLVEGVDLDNYRRSLDPLISLAAAATATSRIRLGTGVLLAAQHDPILLAKQLATLDHISQGRVVLGIGFGWNRTEAGHHGVAFAERREIAADKIACVRAIWRDDVASYSGPYAELSPSYSWPKPVQSRIPILIGGGAGPKLFSAIASWADGWMPVGGAGLSEALPVLRSTMVDAGRDPSQLRVVPFGTIPDPGKLAYYESLGVTEVVLRVHVGTRDRVLATLDDYARLLG